MTKQTTITLRVGYAGLIVLMVGAILWRLSHPVVIEEPLTQIEPMHMAGLALKLFADDHDGILPGSFRELSPVYTTNKTLLDEIEFLAPGKRLADLPAQTVLARRPYKDHHGEKWMSVVYADLTAKRFKP